MRGRLAGAALGIAAAGVLAGCGSSAGGSTTSTDGASTSSSSAAPAYGAGPSAAAPSAAQVPVAAADFSLRLCTTSFAPGTYTFVMSNGGDATHALALDGPGVDNQKSGTAGPGGSASLPATLQPGKYTLYCPVGNHRAMGMQTTFTVG